MRRRRWMEELNLRRPQDFGVKGEGKGKEKGSGRG